MSPRLLLCLLGLVALLAVAPAGCGGDDDDSAGGQKTGTNVEVKHVGIGEEDEPAAMVAGRDALWIGVDGKLLEADPVSGAIRRRIRLPVAGNPGEMAVDDQTVWLTVFTNSRERLVGVDIQSGKVEREPFVIPFQYPIEIVTTDGFVWLSSNHVRNRTLFGYDIEAGRITKRIPRVGNSGLAGGDDALWMTSDDGLVRVDPASARVTGGPFSLPPETNPIAVGDGVVWTATYTGIVSRSDPESGKPIGQSSDVAKLIDDLDSGPLGTWVSASFDDRIMRLDPKTGKPSLDVELDTQTVEVGDRAVYAPGVDPKDEFRGGLYIVTVTQ